MDRRHEGEIMHGYTRRAALHHPRVYCAGSRRWCWSCSCGSGVQSSSTSFVSQHAALVSALVHIQTQPAAR